MGGGLTDCAARQHADLTRPVYRDAASGDATLRPAIRNVVLILLSIDGVISAVVAALFLPSRIGTIPFPISALISGVLNAALVWAALQWTQSTRLAALPLWAWLLTVAALTFGGPGNDIIFGGAGIMEYAVLVLIVLGAAPPAVVLWRHNRAR
jgi:hypothetical protein